jgi:hypothetical protein
MDCGARDDLLLSRVLDNIYLITASVTQKLSLVLGTEMVQLCSA